MPDKIKNLFSFIEFLHSNIDNFKRYDAVFNELRTLHAKQSQLRPSNSFSDKVQYKDVHTKGLEKLDIVQENVSTPIEKKAKDLGLYVGDTKVGRWSISIHDVTQADFSADDLPIILKHKDMYIKYRNNTDRSFYMGLFFSDLDRELLEIFGYFDEQAKEDFKAIMPEPIVVDNIEQAVELLISGTQTVSSPKAIESENLAKPNNKTDAVTFNFNSLFKEEYKEKIDDFIQILRGGDDKTITGSNDDLQPLINDRDEWTGNKQAAKVYINALINKGVFLTNTKPSGKYIATVFSEKFNGLGTAFNTTTPGYKAKDYESYFNKEIGLIIKT